MRDSVDVSEMDINLTSDGEMSLERLIKKIFTSLVFCCYN